MLATTTVLALLTFVTPNPSQYEVNKIALQPKIEEYAEKYHVSEHMLNYIIAGESGYNKDDVGDTNLTCKKTGQPMHARGLVQIVDCFWPDISDDQALDSDFAIDFLAKHLSLGHCSYWTLCRRYKAELAML